MSTPAGCTIRVAKINEIDVIDEALIDADRATVYAALGDLIRGKAQWWLPAVEVRPRTEIGSDLVGAVYGLAVRRLPAPIPPCG